MSFEIYIVGYILAFIICVILYIYDIKNTYNTIERRKKEFIDNILGMLLGISLVSVLSWAIVAVATIFLLGNFINKFFKFIMCNTNFGKFIIYKIFK
jgi:hypothetical protein